MRIRRSDGDWDVIGKHLPTFESMLSTMADPERAPELLRLREEVRSWRFYDHFRADSEAAARQIQIGTRTPALAHDGRDVAAAIQTIVEIGDRTALDRAVEDAFPGARVYVEHGGGPLFAHVLATRIAETAVGRRAVGWDSAIPVVGRSAAHTAPARIDDFERARNKSASGSVAGIGAIDI